MPQALRLDPTIRDRVAPLFAMLETVAQRAHEFDVIHLHCDYLGYPVLRARGVPFLATLHGRLDLPELRPLYKRVLRRAGGLDFELPARAACPRRAMSATVYHGLPEQLLLPGNGSWRIPGLSRPYFTGEGAGPGHPYRGSGRDEAEDRRQDRSRRPRILQRARSSRFSHSRMSSLSARSASTRNPSFWARRRACCSRSRGRSRSAWR